MNITLNSQFVKKGHCTQIKKEHFSRTSKENLKTEPSSGSVQFGRLNTCQNESMQEIVLTPSIEILRTEPSDSKILQKVSSMQKVNSSSKPKLLDFKEFQFNPLPPQSHQPRTNSGESKGVPLKSFSTDEICDKENKSIDHKVE